MSEGIDERALPMGAPRRLVVAHGIAGAAVRAGGHGALHKGVRVVDEHLDPDRGRADRTRRRPAVVRGLTQEDRRPGHRQPHHRPEIPQPRGAHRPAVPLGGCLRVGYRQHQRDRQAHVRRSPSGTPGSASRERSTVAPDRTSAWMSSVTSHTLMFMPATTRPSFTQNAMTSGALPSTMDGSPRKTTWSYSPGATQPA